MSYNGSGTFAINTAGNPVVTGTAISSTSFNGTMTDIASGLSNAITRDGQSPATANLPMGSNKITGLANGTATTDSATFGQAGQLGVYTPAGVGAVATTVQAKLRESVSVKDFGAVGDGVTDDTIALQKFLDACKDNKGYIPPGKYKITSSLFVYPQYGYNIEGAAWDNAGTTGTVIYNAGTGNAITLDNDPYVENFDSDIRFKNITVTGNALSLNGFYVRHCMIHLENVWSTNNGTNGIYLERGYSSSFKQVVCAQNAQNGLSINRAANAIHFDHCIFNGNGKSSDYAGCYISGFTDGYNYGIVFTACDFTGNGSTVAVGYGIIVQYARGISLIGCYGEANKTHNIYADSTTKNLTVQGCYWQDAACTITNVDGLIYENNHHQYVTAATSLSIDAGLPTGKNQTRIPAQ